jgi:hypothetical protein
MDIRDRVKNLKERMTNTWGWDEETVEAWWTAKNILFRGKTPEELTGDEKEFKRLETLIRFSTIPKVWAGREPEPEQSQLPLK